VEQASATPGSRVRLTEAVEQSIDVLSNGPALPGAELQVCVDGQLSAADGLVGELAVKSPFNFMGYFHRPELDREAFLDGWYLTGDIGFVLDGEVYVIGRRKEMLIVHGKNYFATDLEFALNRVPGIKSGRVVAIGVFNAVIGSEELVVVAERDATATVAAGAIEDGIADVLSRGFALRAADILVVEERWLVKSTSGKISRESNRSKYLQARSA
jgi:acyl-CoA synthetase (AMP-forming)/AMP-acid ligase II